MTISNIKPMLLILLAAALLTLLLTHSLGAYGHMEVRVVDAYTLMPIEGAYVSLPQEDVSLYTESDGSASITGIRILKNPALKALYQAGRGECTLIAVKEGYRPTVLFHAEIKKDEVRRLSLYLFPEDADGEEIIAITETPDMQWLSDFVKTFSPPVRE